MYFWLYLESTMKIKDNNSLTWERKTSMVIIPYQTWFKLYGIRPALKPLQIWVYQHVLVSCPSLSDYCCSHLCFCGEHCAVPAVENTQPLGTRRWVRSKLRRSTLHIDCEFWEDVVRKFFLFFKAKILFRLPHFIIKNYEHFQNVSLAEKIRSGLVKILAAFSFNQQLI